MALARRHTHTHTHTHTQNDPCPSLLNTHPLYAIMINVCTVRRMTALSGHWQGQASSVRT